MRDIKFRAWDLTNNQMYFNGDDFGTTHDYEPLIHKKQGQNVELMQYTGLKDANGVEIYEGDIINHDSIGIGVVEYMGNQAAYKIVFKGTTRKWFVDMLDREYGLISVVGNIHENKELLA